MASSVRSRSSAAASAFSNAAMYWSRITRAPADGRLGDLVGAQGQFPQPGPGPLQRALDRRRRGTEDARDLGGGKRQHVPEDQHGPLLRRKVLQAGHERQPQRLARRDDGRGISRVRGNHRVRHRLQPAHLGPGCFQVPIGIGFRVAQARGHHPAAAPGQLGQAGIGGDLVQPGPHRGPALEPAVGPPGTQVCLLDQVFRILDRAEHAVAVREQLTPERLGVLGEADVIGHGVSSVASLSP